MKIHSALDAGGGCVVKMVTAPSRDRFQAHSMWGIQGIVIVHFRPARRGLTRDA
jgi:hypothetical protein